MATESLSPLADQDRAAMGEHPSSGDRLPKYQLLLRTKIGEGRAAQFVGSGSGTAAHLREAGHPAQGAGNAGRRGGGCGVRQRLGGDHLQGKTGRARHHLLPVLRGGAATSGSGKAIPRHGGALYRQLFRHPQFGRVQRRLVLLHPARCALPDGVVHLLPHQCKRTPDSSSAR